MTVQLLAAPAAFAASEPAWRATVGYDTLQNRSACLMESRPVIVDDGQTTTPVRFVYNGQAFLVLTESNIDLSYPGVGLRIDSHAAFAIDRVHGDTNVVFAEHAAAILERLIRGSRARLSLGFWPTWPKGETVTAEFSLIGFTKAHQAFGQCQRDGWVDDGGERRNPR